MIDQITFYSHKASPYCIRAALAFAEAGASPTTYYIDLMNKPEWYFKVNPVGEIPAITIGARAADQPLPNSIKLAESMIIVEFVADLYPDSGLLPKDPVDRAKARFFVDAVNKEILPTWWRIFNKAEDSVDELLNGLEYVQGLFPADTAYATGDSFTIADIAIVPFLGLMEIAFKNDLGAFARGDGPKIYERIRSSKFDRLWGYMDRVKERKSFQDIFDWKFTKELLTIRFGSRA